MTPAAGRGRPLLVAWCALLSVVLIAPTLVVVPMGFTSAQTFAFPPPGWSTRWYKSFFSNPQWYDAALLSLKVALIVVVLATVLGTAASLAVARGRGRWTGALRSLFLAPMIVPGVITAIGIYIVFLKWHLTETVLGFVLAHTMMALPLVIITVGASLQSLDRSLERAAASLGANPWRTFTGVTLPLIMPGMLTGALFAAEFACLFAGLQYTTASRLTVFVYTSPLWVAAIVPLMVRSERLRPEQWAGVVLAFVAIVFALRESFVAAPASRDAALMWRGDLLALVAGALWGLTTVVIRTTGLTKVSAEKLLFYQVAVSATVLPFISLALGEAWSFTFSGFAWFSLVLQTIVGAFASYLAWMWLLGRYPATRVSVFVFLTPAFALVFGAWWLGEPITVTLVAALAFVAVGIVLVNRKR